jgi:pimeloyl-ACP methyl ester carboxylesterase
MQDHPSDALPLRSAQGDNTTIRYHDEGEGPALVVLPSLGRGPADYDHLAALLVAHGVRVMRPFPRGIGGSTGPMHGLSLHDLAADVAVVIEASGLPKAAIAGHAYGNFVARTLASDRPDLVRGVALVAASAGKTADGRSPYAADVLHAVYHCGDLDLPEAERLQLLQLAFFAPGNDARVWLGGWHAATKAMQKEAQAATPVDDFFSCGTAPVLDLQAREDTVAPRALAGFLRESLGTRVTVQVIPNAGHALIPEQPQAVCDALVRWLHSLPAA